MTEACQLACQTWVPSSDLHFSKGHCQHDVIRAIALARLQHAGLETKLLTALHVGTSAIAKLLV